MGVVTSAPRPAPPPPLPLRVRLLNAYRAAARPLSPHRAAELAGVAPGPDAEYEVGELVWGGELRSVCGLDLHETDPAPDCPPLRDRVLVEGQR